MVYHIQDIMNFQFGDVLIAWAALFIVPGRELLSASKLITVVIANAKLWTCSITMLQDNFYL